MGRSTFQEYQFLYVLTHDNFRYREIIHGNRIFKYLQETKQKISQSNILYKLKNENPTRKSFNMFDEIHDNIIGKGFLHKQSSQRIS